MDRVSNLDVLLEDADNRLLELLQAPAYVEACALVRELEDLLADLDQDKRTEALSTFHTIVILRSARRRRHG